MTSALLLNVFSIHLNSIQLSSVQARLGCLPDDFL